MPLDDYTFQLDTGPILNGDDTVVPFVDVDRVIGLDNAPYRETIRDHEGLDGSFIDAEFERGRDIILEGMAYCDIELVEEYMDELKANFAPVTEPIPFVFKAPGSDERMLLVKPRGCRYDWLTLRRTGMTPIQFLMFAEDPRIYSNELQTENMNYGGDATTGFGFSFDFDLDFGVVVPPTGGQVTVGGNRPTPPVFTITGPVENPRIVNLTDGFSLNFTISLSGTDSLVVTPATRQVILNDTVNARYALTTMDWFFLNPGVTQFALGGASGSGQLSIAFRDAWR
jgi:hypothetical protein